MPFDLLPIAFSFSSIKPPINLKTVVVFLRHPWHPLVVIDNVKGTLLGAQETQLQLHSSWKKRKIEDLFWEKGGRRKLKSRPTDFRQE